ncbi:MAG: ATP synthase subunit I [Myxococcota bacterium]|jgi:hypothetical protein|nr:hypothetical protein [Deltaproteobacteria bacterium]MDP6076366.1 ATP synthase subunit I [Myxococcota bacterium]MDP6242093.1 ATP synthase subunit I [Myxococcota bacterium]MDP7074109.1 ATP synthase subunit I [Myxococcota bacterium]MDP7299273.1 ATP synthase subunit I [Myxococcota bacterium]
MRAIPWIQDPIEQRHAILAAAAIAGSAAAVGPWFAASLALGVVLAMINFRALQRAARRLSSGELAGARPWVALFIFRFGLLGAAMYWALASGAHPIGLVVGLSLIVPSVVLFAWRGAPAVVTHSDAPPPDDPSWDEWNPWLARGREPDDGESL